MKPRRRRPTEAEPRRLERKRNGEKRDLPARFLSKAKNACERQGTAKELDEENGFYYYGARYLDPKYSRWLSTDPALGEYIPQAPINDEARRHNQNLPGMGGVFNAVNLNLYHYSTNKPIRYTDPDGRASGFAFDCKNFIAHQFNAVGAGFYIAFRQMKSYAGNFFANLFTGKGDVGIVTSGSVNIGDISYGCTITGTVKKGFQ